MSEPTAPLHRIAVADLSGKAPTPFDLRPDAPDRAAMAERLGIRGIRKLRLAGKIRAEGKTDWRLEAELGATVVQDCVVTLQPVTTRLDVAVTRRFLAEMPVPEADEHGEVQMPEDDTIEPLGSQIHLDSVLEEALALALPLYPRAEGAELGEAVHAAPGVTPLRDADAKPFAGLAELRDALTGGNDPDSDDEAGSQGGGSGPA